jgi:hypothetical protein
MGRSGGDWEKIVGRLVARSVGQANDKGLKQGKGA